MLAPWEKIYDKPKQHMKKQTSLWCFWNVVLEKILESPLDIKVIKPVHTKGNHTWIFTGRADAGALILWPPDMKSQLIGKDPDAEKNWGHEEKGTTEDEMVGWHHQLDGYEFEQALRDGKGHGGLLCCDHGVTKSWTQLSNWTELNWNQGYQEPSFLSIISTCIRKGIVTFFFPDEKITKKLPSMWFWVYK